MKVVDRSEWEARNRKLDALFRSHAAISDAEQDGYAFMLDSAAKFFQTVYISGWFHHATDRLKDVYVIDRHCHAYHARIGVAHGGVATLGSNLGFRLQLLRDREEIDETLEIVFVTQGNRGIRRQLLEMSAARISRYPSPDMSRRFVERVHDIPSARVLDIGGRARSRLDRSSLFKVAEYVVLDILPGENVDVVGDAHALSRLFPADYFDAVYSVSVFEHLVMPWVVALQINRVLKNGGIGLISTHQTLGMHDLPWDFWRFSDTSWSGIFNRHTGFEILETALDFEQYIIPFLYRSGKEHAERDAGFEGSVVLVRKIGNTDLRWNLAADDVVRTAYPDFDDGQNMLGIETLQVEKNAAVGLTDELGRNVDAVQDLATNGIVSQPPLDSDDNQTEEESKLLAPGSLRWDCGEVTELLCLPCGRSTRMAPLVSVLNPLSGSDLTFHRCQRCGSLMPHPFASPDYAAFKAIEPAYEQHYVEINAGPDAIASIIAPLGKVGDLRTFLDVGCGYGLTVAFARQMMRWEAVGIEPGSYGRLGARDLELDIEDRLLGSGSKFDGKQFDIVFCSEVLEHLDDPAALLRLLFGAVADRGLLYLTTPAAEFVQQPNWHEQILAALSPGYHSCLFTELALETSLLRAGFSHVRVNRQHERLVAIAGKNRSLDEIDLGRGDPAEAARSRQLYLDFLQYLSGNRKWTYLRDGARFRLYKEYVNVGAFDDARRVWEELRASIEERYGIGFFTTANYARLAVEAENLERFSSVAPFFLAPLLFYRGVDLLNGHNRPDLALEAFKAAELIATVEVEKPQAYFIESASLLWNMRYHEALCLLLTERREEALAIFDRIITVGEGPAPQKDRGRLDSYLVERSLNQAGVAHLQLGRKAEARTRFEAVLRRHEAPENAGLHAEARHLLAEASP